MSERIHVLAQQLFGKSSLDDCDLLEIKKLVNSFPYFAPAQFLLLEKLKRENDPGYSAQLQKAVLYYHDPLEFEYFISSGRFETDIHFEENEPLVISDDVNSEEESVPLIGGADGEVLYVPTVVHNTNIPEQVSDAPEPEATMDEPVEPEPTLEEVKMTESIERVLEQEEKQIHQPADTDQLVFEPYHTVDYFASQGIKLSQEELPKDKFGKQLMSFTEWLKTLKRLPPTEVSKDVDPSTESKVQHLAEDSVHQSEVVTEAMAEVWIKQGNKAKAIETYNKLGLLNPSKKAYFAGLIENLKRS
ncbi:MAG: hypothetical protein ACXVBH_03315 [Flavisolibacter sp.]